MNAPPAHGPNQAVVDAQERARQNAAKVAKQMTAAKTATAVRAILDTLSGMNQSGELGLDDMVRLTKQGEGREFGLIVEEGLASAASRGEAPWELLRTIATAPELTPDAAERKRAAKKRVLIICGEREIERARTIRLVTQFLGTEPSWIRKGSTGLLDTPQYQARDQEDTQEVRGRLRSLACERLAAMKWARLKFALSAVVLLFAGPFFVMMTQVPVIHTDIVRLHDLFKSLDDMPVTHSSRYLYGAAICGLARHPFLMALVPLFIAAVIIVNRIPGHGIDWLQALNNRRMTKLLAIAAWTWLFTLLLTHP